MPHQNTHLENAHRVQIEKTHSFSKTSTTNPPSGSKQVKIQNKRHPQTIFLCTTVTRKGRGKIEFSENVKTAYLHEEACIQVSNQRNVAKQCLPLLGRQRVAGYGWRGGG
mgnify:CR=1 FL=1